MSIQAVFYPLIYFFHLQATYSCMKQGPNSLHCDISDSYYGKDFPLFFKKKKNSLFKFPKCLTSSDVAESIDGDEVVGSPLQ